MKLMTIKDKYDFCCTHDSDIFQHLPIIYDYAKKCNHN